MNKQVLTQLDKILALVDSNHEGEAAAAVRMARQMLANENLSFGDLARAAQEQRQKPKLNIPRGFLSVPQSQLEKEITELRQQLDDQRVEVHMQEVQVQYWRQRSNDLDIKLVNTQDEAMRWRQLARDTVEKLWDLGLAVQQYDQTHPEDDVAPEAKKAE